MDVTLILQVAGIGITVAIVCQFLTKAGREEQAMLVSLVGIVLVLAFLVGKLGELFDAVRSVFGL